MLTDNSCLPKTFEFPPFTTNSKDIVSLFEEQAKRSPEAIALVSGDEKLTYRELNRRANQLAWHLLDLGAAKHSFVAICLDRSFETIVGILGILKLGAAYVPVDPQYPVERIRYILNDAEISLTLITKRTIDPEVLKELVRPVYLDDASNTQHLEGVNLGVDIEPSFSAYVMYTSGTTGEPKGVEIPHSGIVRLLKSSNYIHLDSTDVVLHHATCSFDAATFEIWAALLNGGTLVLYPPQAFDMDTLESTIADYGITTLLLITPVFHLVAEHKLDCFGTLKQLVVGGDVLQAKAVKKVIERHPHLKIVNGYGPTENTVFTCCYVITHETEIGEILPIGKPITGTNVFILDENLRPVEVGEVGELYTNGLGMAKGYLNRRDLTRERFVPCPFPEAGQILYKTGDLVRMDLDGNVYFLGRADSQVKIRGFRVEPGEIENVINLRSNIAESVVLAQTNHSGEKHLVAYVTLSGADSQVDEREIKHYLSSRLPQHMIPAYIHIIDKFPMTQNGKIDKKRLPSMVQNSQKQEMSLNAYASNYLQIILNVWKEQLGVAFLQADDSLYDYGASSITTIVVQSKLNERFLCAIDPLELLKAQTPLEWAKIYEAQINSQCQASI